MLLTSRDIKNLTAETVGACNRRDLVGTDREYEEVSTDLAKWLYKKHRAKLGKYTSKFNDCENLAIGYLYFCQGTRKVPAGFLRSRALEASVAMWFFAGFYIMGSDKPHAANAFFSQEDGMLWQSAQTGQILMPTGKETVTSGWG